MSCDVCEGNKCSLCAAPFAASAGMMECECPRQRLMRLRGGGKRRKASAGNKSGGVSVKVKLLLMAMMASAGDAVAPLPVAGVNGTASLGSVAQLRVEGPHMTMLQPAPQGSAVSQGSAMEVLATVAAVRQDETDACEWLRLALAEAASGQVGDVVLNHLLLAMGQTQVKRATQAAARAALQVLARGAEREAARLSEGATRRSMVRWLGELRDLMEDCNVVVATSVTVVPAGGDTAPAAAESSEAAGAMAAMAVAVASGVMMAVAVRSGAWMVAVPRGACGIRDIVLSAERAGRSGRFKSDRDWCRRCGRDGSVGTGTGLFWTAALAGAAPLQE